MICLLPVSYTHLDVYKRQAVYRVPLVNILGDTGMGYYGVAFQIYAIVLTLTSYSLPLAVSKLISARVATKE